MNEPVTLNRIITGAGTIGRMLGVSKATVLRMAEDHRLRTFRTGPHTSPIKCSLSEINRVRRGGVTPQSNANAA
jgi:hypothetical protein